jgi:S-DNA-T family DNA segregation ATPase FtsK/SpoIIIE
VDVTVTVVDGRGRHSNVRVRGGGAARVGELADALVEAGVRGPAERDLYAGSGRLPPDALLGASVLHGQVLGATPAPAPEPSLRELRVVGGLRSGDTYPLRPGPTLVGRAPEAGVVLADERVSRAHVRLVVDAAGVTVRDLGSTNGTQLEGRTVRATGLRWPEGVRLRLGDTVLEVGLPEPPRAAPAAEAGRLTVVPPPRLRTPAPSAEVRHPEPPPPVRRARVPLAAALAPLAVGVVAAAVLGSATFLLFALLSPVVVLAGAASDRGQARRESRDARDRHRTLVVAAVEAVAAAVAAEAEHRHSAHPDCAALRQVALHRGPRLWERRAGDDDVLRLRLGTADQPALVRVVGGPPAVCPAVPIAVALPEAGALGIAGSRQDVLASARALLGSAVVLHSPALLDVVVVSAVPGDWAWTRWLPHVRDRTAGGVALLDGLLAAVDQPAGPAHGGQAPPEEPRARTLVVVDDPGLCDSPALRGLAARGAAGGIHLVCLAAHVRDLPPGCTVVLADGGPEGWVLRQDGRAPVTGICPDGVSASWAEGLARSLAPLSVASAPAASSLPPDVAWRELEGLRLAGDVGDTVQVLERWSRPGPAVTLGLSTAGPLTLDLRRTGPHCLVAGTTGSGKSELLQTLVAGLALANPPEALQLLLVDYKGGAAFGRCVDLPHTAGLVTDLDPALTRRALASLSAELRRREALLLRAGAPDLTAYEHRRERAAGKAGPELPALARLVLVIDEFATLADELPDFVRGLIAVAQRGRSLGVHLVLATQRPEGSVSQDIRANTALRLCLAVAREAESRDVLDAPDAASIGRGHPGRGYLRHGAEGLVLFQGARVGVPRAEGAPAASALRVEVLPHGAPAPLPPPAARRPDPVEGPTDLDLLVAACAAAAERRGVPRPAPPWLPPLPERVLLADLEAAAGLPDGDVLVPFALQDLPAEQGRRVLSLDLRANLVVVGGPRSGRTTSLVTVAGAAATRLPPDRLHLVGLDLAGTALRGLEQLPHCGVVVTRDEPERLARLVAALSREITRRRAAGGGPLPPHVLLLLDSWDGFVSAYGDVDAGGLVDALTRVLREGPSVGVTAAVSSDRTALVGRVSGLLPQRLLLHLPDAGDYAAAGVAPRDVPADLPPGRGVHDSGLLTQVALLHPDPSLPPAEVLARLGLAPAPPGAGEPLRVDPLPARVTATAAEALRAAPRPLGRLVTPGVGGDRLRPLDVDLDEAGPVVLVAGPPRSGRSTALLTCLASLLDGVRAAGGPPQRVVVLAPRPGPLRTPPEFGVPVTVVTDPRGDLRDLVEPATVLVVDDAEQVTDPAALAALDAAFAGARDMGTAVLAAGTTSALLSCYRPWAEEARRGRTGLLLAPEAAADGDLLGCRLPRSTGTGVAGPGRGLLVVRGQALPLQVALPAPPATGGESPQRCRLRHA